MNMIDILLHDRCCAVDQARLGLQGPRVRTVLHQVGCVAQVKER